MSVKAIVKGGTIDNCVRCWSRHATPRAFTHLIVSGASGRAILSGIDPAASGLFIFNHPTLGDWSAVPALFKREDGGVLHAFAGVTPDDGGEPLTENEFAGCASVELYVLGHIERLANVTARDGSRYVGLVATDATLLDAIKPAAVVFRSDTMLWADVPDLYKLASGAPRVDPDTVRETAIVRRAGPALPPG